MKDELNCSYNGGGLEYLLQSVAIHFNITVITTFATLIPNTGPCVLQKVLREGVI